MITDNIKTIIKLQLGISRVEDKDRILEDLGAESADLVGIVAAVEDRFQIAVDEEEISLISTVADLHKLVGDKLDSLPVE